MKPAIKKSLIFAFSITISFAAAGIGTLATIPNISTWYTKLDKPFFNPPNWVFGPVWTILYALMGVSLYIVIITKTEKNMRDTKRYACIAFGMQLVLNALWTVTFFGLHLVDAAIAVILLLLITLVITMTKFAPFSKPAVWLLVPYTMWVLFATCLNVGISLLN